jgi:hypothetical protein
MRRYSASLLLIVTLCAAGPGVRAQVLQIDADGTPHKIGPGWSVPAASPAVSATPQAGREYVIPAAAGRTAQLMLNDGGERLLEYRGNSSLEAVRDYVNRKHERRPSSAAGESALASAGQAHIRDVNYDPNSVIRLAGCVGFQTTIEFAADEHIENVGIGAPSRWLMVPNKRADMLFVEPATTLSHSNMTVITDRHHYYFDLVPGAAEACSRGAVIYSLRLHDPTTTPDTLLQPTAWRHP